MAIKDKAKHRAQRRAQLEVIKGLKGELRDGRLKLDRLYDGAEQLQQAADCIAIRTAIEYGVKVEEEGQTLGYRLELPDISCKDTLSAWELKAEKRDGKLIIGVAERTGGEKDLKV